MKLAEKIRQNAPALAEIEARNSGKPIVGKGYLVVTVPTYMKWDQPEVNP